MPYARPPLPRQNFVDDAGRPYEYGDRWTGLDGPPENTYSMDSHSERFASLHRVADALVAHLTADFDVSRDDDVAPQSLLRPPSHGISFVRATRLIPAAADTAPLTLVWTDYPDVRLEAGALLTEPFPVCGCDACDESLGGVADALESCVLAIAGGGLREWVRGGRLGRPFWTGHSLVFPDGSQGTEGQSNLPHKTLVAARTRLADLPGGNWRAWPRR